MRRIFAWVAACLIALFLMTGCAVVSNVRKREGGSEKHAVVILGLIPIWMSEKPIDPHKDNK